jgi:hypothetical protein
VQEEEKKTRAKRRRQKARGFQTGKKGRWHHFFSSSACVLSFSSDRQGMENVAQGVAVAAAVIAVNPAIAHKRATAAKAKADADAAAGAVLARLEALSEIDWTPVIEHTTYQIHLQTKRVRIDKTKRVLKERRVDGVMLQHNKKQVGAASAWVLTIDNRVMPRALPL